jgi:hypothetical protein
MAERSKLVIILADRSASAGQQNFKEIWDCHIKKKICKM